MTLSRQKKSLLLLSILVLILIVGFHLVYFDMIYQRFQSVFSRKLMFFHKQSSSHSKTAADDSEQDLSSSAYIVKTEHCSIPKTPLVPSFFQNEWRIEKLPECSYEIDNYFLSDDEKTITFSPRNPEEKCCVQEIIQNKTTQKFSLLGCQPSTEDSAIILNKEMFAVKCETSLNVGATFPMKPEVKKKLEFWRSFEDQPPNILIVGIDSVSRLHAHRSIPKALKLMKEMNFLEFQGYHSVGASTLANFMPLLMGLSLEEARQLCAPNWNSSFDDCPFIWNIFNESNYVTNFLEDGQGSFNWGGQGGFKNPPTDYYIRPLFQALKSLRLKSFGKRATRWTKEIFRDCVSSESVPQFLLRYTRRFVEKFWNAPFFSFTWLAYPFHEHIYSLAGFDDHLTEFFQGIRDDSPVLLENTLIIFLSDHGFRTSLFQSSVEGFIERSLPPLLIRIPEAFEENYPHLAVHVNALKNSRRLTTPWDVHHTLLHTASLFPSPNVHMDNFPPILKDRASLLSPVPLDRSCETVKIPLKNCVCDTVMGQVIGNASSLLKQIVGFINVRLNEILRNSQYSLLCHEWSVKEENVESFRFLGTSRNSSDYLVVFSADPGDARFEARFIVPNKEESLNGGYELKLIGPFTRINSYGNQSACVKFQTDADKDMKELCVCK